MLVWSTGAHLYMALSSSIGLRLASEGQEGRMLGKLGFLESLGTLLGMVIVYLAASSLHFSFGLLFGIAGGCSLLAALALYFIKPRPLVKAPRRLIFKRKYALFYWLNILFGARKQIYLTFAPWVLIKIFHTSVATFAVMGFIGTVINLLFRPMLGRAIDAWGEKAVIAAESLILILMSILYGFSSQWFAYHTALVIVMACYIGDQILFSVRMARTIYLNNIADSPEDIAPTLSMGLTMDHAVSMLIPLGGGLLWAKFGYSWVFVSAGCIALINLFISILIPSRKQITYNNASSS
jgi:hypothetical protein